MVAIKELQKQFNSLDAFTDAVNKSYLQVQGKSFKVHLEIKGKSYEITRNQLVKLAIALTRSHSQSTLWQRVGHLKALDKKLHKLQKAEETILKSATRGYGPAPEEIAAIRRRQKFGNLLFNRERAISREIGSLKTKIDKNLERLIKFSEKIAKRNLMQYKATYPSAKSIDKATTDIYIRDLNNELLQRKEIKYFQQDQSFGIAHNVYKEQIDKIWPK